MKDVVDPHFAPNTGGAFGLGLKRFGGADRQQANFNDKSRALAETVALRMQFHELFHDRPSKTEPTGEVIGAGTGLAKPLGNR